MAQLSQDLQDKLSELERELEVRRSIVKHAHPRSHIMALALELAPWCFARRFAEIARDILPL